MTDDHPALLVRRLERHDLPDAIAIQLANYPAFLTESEEAFASRLDLAASYCLGATMEGVLVAYLLAHGWQGQSPPPLGTVLPPDSPREVLFIHDLAVGSAGRGLGIGRMLVAQAFARAARDGLREAELVAVEGAASYWIRLGFAEAPATRELLSKVAAYGADARWMTRRIDGAGNGNRTRAFSLGS